MSDSVKLYYKTCREMAGLTQDQAMNFLHISEVSTLSKYENGHSKVPDIIVKQMAALYRSEKLVLWHIRYTHPELGDWLPDITEPKSDGDMAFDIVLAKDDMIALEEQIKSFLRDGFLDSEETRELKVNSLKIKQIISKLTSVAAYIDEKTVD